MRDDILSDGQYEGWKCFAFLHLMQKAFRKVGAAVGRKPFRKAFLIVPQGHLHIPAGNISSRGARYHIAEGQYIIYSKGIYIIELIL